MQHISFQMAPKATKTSTTRKETFQHSSKQKKKNLLAFFNPKKCKQNFSWMKEKRKESTNEDQFVSKKL